MSLFGPLREAQTGPDGDRTAPPPSPRSSWEYASKHLMSNDLVPIRSAGEHNAAVSDPQAVWHRVTGVLQCNVCPGPRRDGELSLLRH